MNPAAGKLVLLDSANYTLEQKFNADLSESPCRGFVARSLSLKEFIVLQCKMQLSARESLRFAISAAEAGIQGAATPADRPEFHQTCLKQRTAVASGLKGRLQS